MKKIIVLLTITSLLFAGVVFATTNHSKKFDKVTICHATGSGNFVTIVTSPHAINGHFLNNGTPKAGHEEDLLYEGDEVECPTGGGGGGGGEQCIPPEDIEEVEVDTGILNDNNLNVSWEGGDGADTVKISYSWDFDNLDQEVITDNDGFHELGGLTNGIHYWVQVTPLKEGCDGNPSEKIDPLP